LKLWSKNNTSATHDLSRRIEQFTTGDDIAFDLLLAPFDVQGSIAHTRMLAQVGLITAEEGRLLTVALSEIAGEIETGKFAIEPGVEDVHSQVELLLTRRLGDTGKKVHTARSRNDQVLLDLKLWLRAALEDMAAKTVQLGKVLLDSSERHRNVLLPGYTHLQMAMPSSFGLWFGAYAESLAEDLFVAEAAFRTANQCPLGSAAGYGSSLPIDRVLTARLLGFEGLNWNVVYAQMTRGKTEKTAGFALAQIAATLGRMCMDITLYMSQNLGFLSLPAHLTTGSSIMPHKKNPDVFELIRAWCNEMQGLPGTIQYVLGNLPSGYHRDLQILKGQIMPAFQRLTACLEMATAMIPELIVAENITSDAQYRYLFSVEAVNRLVGQGVPFRDAYRQVGADIDAGHFSFSETVTLPATADALEHSHVGSLGNLCTDAIREKLERAGRWAFPTDTSGVKAGGLRQTPHN
jgi:argininosuccinate lyase